MSLIEDIELLSEKKRTLAEAPSQLMLQLKNVQQFPNGQKVALYFCPTIKKYFSFVYGKEGIISEEELFLEKLQLIEDVEEITFNDGTTLNIDSECSNLILSLYESTEEKGELLDYIQESDNNFLNALKYSKLQDNSCQYQE
jgi:hypothetical protein